MVNNLGVKSVHRSVPHAEQWWTAPPVDRIIVIVRDPFITEVSATEAGHPRVWQGLEATFPYRITHAWEVIVDKVREAGVPWIPLTYEGLLARPQETMDNVARWLDVEPQPLPEPVEDPRR